MTFFQHITFDLDDTLLDTSGALIPAAARRAVEKMIQASGTPDELTSTAVETWVAKRAEILRADPRADVWLRLAKGDDEVADVGRRAFFTYPIETLPTDAVRPTPGAIEILKWSQEHAVLHLVTSGDLETQRKKIARLEIADFFESIQFVDPKHSYGRTKQQAFQVTQSRFRDAPPTQFLSVGNRVDMDLGEAKALGWKTAWVRYGEHAGLTPQNPNEIPDFEVSSLADLLSIWRQYPNINSSKTNQTEGLKWKT